MGKVDPRMSPDAVNDHICVFVASSDNTRDVLRQVIPSFGKSWPDCPFERFVGLNSAAPPGVAAGFHPVYAPVSGWRAELLAQIRQLPARYGHVLLLLDDFLILSPVDADRLRRLFAEALRRGLDYVRLVPVRRAAAPRLARALVRDAGGIEPISPSSPYYSSLQAALWKRGHLLETLETAGRDIWAFEHQRLDGRPHFAIAGDPPIDYRHVVEKGRWQPYAARLFASLDLPFHPGGRAALGRLASLTLWLNRVKFAVLGYSVVRLRRSFRA